METKTLRAPKHHVEEITTLANEADATAAEVLDEILTENVDYTKLEPKGGAVCPVCGTVMEDYYAPLTMMGVILCCPSHGSVVHVSPEGRELIGEAEQSNDESGRR